MLTRKTANGACITYQVETSDHKIVFATLTFFYDASEGRTWARKCQEVNRPIEIIEPTLTEYGVITLDYDPMLLPDHPAILAVRKELELWLTDGIV